jgi:hypothetical protein
LRKTYLHKYGITLGINGTTKKLERINSAGGVIWDITNVGG